MRMTRPELIQIDGNISCDWRVRVTACTDEDFMTTATLVLLILTIVAVLLGGAHCIYRYWYLRWPLIIDGIPRGIELMLVFFVFSNLVTFIRCVLVLYYPDTSIYAIELLFVSAFMFSHLGVVSVCISTVCSLGVLFRSIPMQDEFSIRAYMFPSQSTIIWSNTIFTALVFVTCFGLEIGVAQANSVGDDIRERVLYSATYNLLACFSLMMALAMVASALPFIIALRQRFAQSAKVGQFPEVSQQLAKTRLEFDKMTRVVILVTFAMPIMYCCLFALADQVYIFQLIPNSRLVYIFFHHLMTSFNIISLSADTIFLVQLHQISAKPSQPGSDQSRSDPHPVRVPKQLDSKSHPNQSSASVTPLNNQDPLENFMNEARVTID